MRSNTFIAFLCALAALGGCNQSGMQGCKEDFLRTFDSIPSNSNFLVPLLATDGHDTLQLMIPFNFFLYEVQKSNNTPNSGSLLDFLNGNQMLYFSSEELNMVYISSAISEHTDTALLNLPIQQLLDSAFENGQAKIGAIPYSQIGPFAKKMFDHCLFVWVGDESGRLNFRTLTQVRNALKNRPKGEE